MNSGLLPQLPDEEFLAITADLLRIFGRTGRLLVKVPGTIGYVHWIKDAPLQEIPHALG